MQWIEGEVSDDGHVPSAMADAQPGLILVELHVQDPVGLVFDGPMGSHSLGELRRIEHRRGDIQASLGRCLAALLAVDSTMPMVARPAKRGSPG